MCPTIPISDKATSFGPKLFPEIVNGLQHSSLGHTYDFIWENMAYGVTKRSGSDQTPHLLRGIKSEPGLFVTYKHLQKTIVSLSEKFKNNLV